jgi:glycosyltransferase involved in cell wall biosynthesis
VTKPVYVFPHGVDTNFYNPFVKKLEIPEAKTFKFLWLGQWTPRKAPDILLSAYYQEFTQNEDVCLILKTYMQDATEEDKWHIFKEIKDMEERYIDPDRPHGLPKVILVHNLLSESKIASLHNTADCFVFPSRGEALGIPVLHAMSCEKPVIATNWSGLTDIINDENAYPLEIDRLVPCQGMEHIPWYQSDMRWAEPSIRDLRRKMRWVFEHPATSKDTGKKARLTMLRKFDWLEIAKKQKARLEEIWEGMKK